MGKRHKKFLLVANGEVDEELLKLVNHKEFDQIVAADGGAKKLLQFGVVPHVVVGDLDSLSQQDFEKLATAQILHRPSQELNDLEKALIYCLEQRVEHVVLLGITGGRTDHTLNNFSVLMRYFKKFKLNIYNRYSEIFLVDDYFEYSGQKGQNVSLIPLGLVTGIKTTGLSYPLDKETLGLGIREGLSNEIVDGFFSVEVENGVLLIFVNRIS